MNKKLKDQIFQEIEKEDNYRDRSHELKSHILFAEKEEKRRPRIWIPALSTALAAVAAVAVIVPTVILNKNNVTSSNIDAIAEADTEVSESVVGSQEAYAPEAGSASQNEATEIKEWNQYFSIIASQYKNKATFGDLTVICYPGILQDGKTIAMGFNVEVKSDFTFDVKLLSFKVNGVLEDYFYNQCGYLTIDDSAKKNITVIYDSVEEPPFEMNFANLS
jgi:hypothetical protein